MSDNVQKMHSVDAIIFDLDGVISDTQKVYAQAISKALSDLGIHITPAQFSTDYAGRSLTSSLQDLSEKSGIGVPDTFSKEMKDRVFHRLEKGVDPMPYAIETLKELKKSHVLALASSSSQYIVELILAQLELVDMFDVIITGSDVTHKKPSPEIYLLTAQRLNTLASNCVVVEDAVAGMQAAKSAGMFVIGYDVHHRTGLPADQVVTELSAVPFIIKELDESFNSTIDE